MSNDHVNPYIMKVLQPFMQNLSDQELLQADLNRLHKQKADPFRQAEADKAMALEWNNPSEFSKFIAGDSNG